MPMTRLFTLGAQRAAGLHDEDFVDDFGLEAAAKRGGKLAKEKEAGSSMWADHALRVAHAGLTSPTGGAGLR
jgi:hypothetical protein